MTEMTLSRRQPSVWWGAMIICGTVVGAGMFTLPVVMAGAWFGWAMVLLLISWGGMLLSGLLFMRVSLKYPPGAGYDTLTKDLLGRGWAALNGLSILFVLGILTYAYISASGPVYQHSISQLGLPTSTAEAKILLTLCVALGVRLENGKYPTLSPFFEQTGINNSDFPASSVSTILNTVTCQV